MLKLLCSCLQTSVRTRTDTHTHTYTNTYAHAHTHTHSHRQTYTHHPLLKSPPPPTNICKSNRRLWKMKGSPCVTVCSPAGLWEMGGGGWGWSGVVCVDRHTQLGN